MPNHDSGQSDPLTDAAQTTDLKRPPAGPPPLPSALPPPLPSPPKQAWPRSKPVVITLVCAAVLATCLAVAFLIRAGASNSQKVRSGARVGTGSEETVIESGISHRNDRFPREPWSIHVAKVDRSRKDLTFFAPLATGKVLGINRISEQAEAVPPEIGRAIAGVNGDFYERDSRTYAGDPRGLQIVNGELVSDASTACVWFDGAGNPHVDDVTTDLKVTWPDGRQTPFGLNEQRRANAAVLYTPTYGASTRVNGGRDVVLERDGSDGPWLPLQAGETFRARVRSVQGSTNTTLPADALVLSLGPTLLANLPEVAPGAILTISTATTPDLKGVKTAIGGGPALIKNGKPFTAKTPPSGAGGYAERSKYERHPRSAIGWNATHIYLLTVDGRQPDLSVGMTLAELANYMVQLGCTDGMNFDGGVSATLWMGGRIVSDPCQGERSVANSLLVVRKPSGP